MAGDHPDSVRSAIEAERRHLAELERQRVESAERLTLLEAQLAHQSGLTRPQPLPFSPPDTPAGKVALFKSLFRGRDDVFPKLWTNTRTKRSGYAPACGNEWVHGICEKPRVRCGECTHQAFTALDDQAVLDHLQGRAVIGVYPMLRDETCWLLAADFDGDAWRDDTGAFLESCRRFGVPAALERSRSGNGAHVWIFFAAPIPAVLARQLGCLLITDAMTHRHELGMRSYDRLFPSQDTMPKGGFGNLIALPLQHGPRQLDNTVFLNEAFVPFADQWGYLTSIQRMARATVIDLVDDAVRHSRILGVRVSEDADEPSAPWEAASQDKNLVTKISEPMPSTVRVIESQQLFVEKAGLPAALLTAIARLAAFQNPEFYKRQSLRLSTALAPRVISCAENLADHLALPRGCEPDLRALFSANGIAIDLEDKRGAGEALDAAFRGELSDLQHRAADALLAHDIGVFVAPPGSGKTVVGAYLVAKRARTALILTHRRPLVDQWRAQLGVFLGLKPAEIGQLGGGRSRATGRLDVAMLQSLVKRDDLGELIAAYGHVVVDECHHVPAVSFERVLKHVKARYLTGLTATPTRRDGHHPILTMRLGPMRFTVKAGGTSDRTSARRRLIVRDTAFIPPGVSGTGGSIQALYGMLADDPARTTMILDDVIAAVAEGRSPVVLTERREHVELMAERLRPFVKNLIVLKGGATEKQRGLALARLHGIPPDEERAVVATGRYLGEGFDDPRLDTLFLALPISWKGTLAQYVGRLHRAHPGKTEVRVYDYVDARVPVLKRMFDRRMKGYRALGYSESS
ncbi:MAG: DEAD/DEAH box helicase family protein [Acidobacteriota bacterium]|nr:DEAD/DEAH box helicase family protein [Acidobacteriota bacterium]